MTPERVLELKSAAEKCINEFNTHVKELHDAGYKVAAQADSSLFIYKDTCNVVENEVNHTSTNTTVREYYGKIVSTPRQAVSNVCVSHESENGSCVRGEN